jgi:hypothetical protein
MLAFVDLEERVPRNHPLRVIRRIADHALAELSPIFDATVDGTLIEADASLKSFRAKDGPPSAPPPDDPGNPTVNFHGQRRSNVTHQSTTDPQALLAKKGKGKEARLAFMGHALMENRNGVVVDFQLGQATGTAERDMAPKLIDEARERGFHPRALAAPFAPHIPEELWERLGQPYSIHQQAFPTARTEEVDHELVRVVVQVNGRPRTMYSSTRELPKQRHSRPPCGSTPSAKRSAIRLHGAWFTCRAASSTW